MKWLCEQETCLRTIASPKLFDQLFNNDTAAFGAFVAMNTICEAARNHNDQHIVEASETTMMALAHYRQHYRSTHK